MASYYVDINYDEYTVDDMVISLSLVKKDVFEEFCVLANKYLKSLNVIKATKCNV